MAGLLLYPQSVKTYHTEMYTNYNIDRFLMIVGSFIQNVLQLLLKIISTEYAKRKGFNIMSLTP